MWAFYLSTAVFISTLVWAQNRKKDPPKIHEIYTQPGKWYYLKYVLFLLLLKLRQLLNKFNKSGGLAKDLENIDKPQQLSDNEKAFDAVFLQGVTFDGYYLAIGVERRQRGKANALIYLVVSCVVKQFFMCNDNRF